MNRKLIKSAINIIDTVSLLILLIIFFSLKKKLIHDYYIEWS